MTEPTGASESKAIADARIVLAWDKVVIASSIAALCLTLVVVTILWALKARTITNNVIVPAILQWKDTSDQTAKVWKDKMPVLLNDGHTLMANTDTRMDTAFKDLHDISTAAVKEVRTAQTATSQLATTTRQAGDAVDAVKALVANSDSSLNGKLFPELVGAVQAVTKLVDKFGMSATEAAEVIKKSGLTVDQMNAILASSDPKVLAALDKVNALVADAHSDLHTIGEDVHDTTKAMPHIMKNIDTTTGNVAKASRLSTVAAIAKIFASIAQGFGF
ncbi:MAG: hypothetical protein ACREDR_00080 [Blastocatellia bacterium]